VHIWLDTRSGLQKDISRIILLIQQQIQSFLWDLKVNKQTLTFEMYFLLICWGFGSLWLPLVGRYNCYVSFVYDLKHTFLPKKIHLKPLNKSCKLFCFNVENYVSVWRCLGALKWLLKCTICFQLLAILCKKQIILSGI
jgi:hypothetical protein